MRPREELVLDMALEAGVRLGLRRYWKHRPLPEGFDTEDQVEVLVDELLASLREWFVIEADELRAGV